MDLLVRAIIIIVWACVSSWRVAKKISGSVHCSMHLATRSRGTCLPPPRPPSLSSLIKFIPNIFALLHIFQHHSLLVCRLSKAVVDCNPCCSTVHHEDCTSHRICKLRVGPLSFWVLSFKRASPSLYRCAAGIFFFLPFEKNFSLSNGSAVCVATKYNNT